MEQSTQMGQGTHSAGSEDSWVIQGQRRASGAANGPISQGTLRCRQVGLAKYTAVPSSIDQEGRSVEAVFATETPVVEYDYERNDYVPTVLLMAGCNLPASGQIVALNNHQRQGDIKATVVGSARGLRVVGGQLVGRIFFADVADAEWALVSAGHLSDVSIGRTDEASTFIPEGQTQVIGAKRFDGPVRVITAWTPKEISLTPIGADANAKFRAANHIEIVPVPAVSGALSRKGVSTMEPTTNVASGATQTPEIATRTAVDSHLLVRNEKLGWDGATLQRIRAACHSIKDVDEAIFTEIAERAGPKAQLGGAIITGYGQEQSNKQRAAIGTALQMRCLAGLGDKATEAALPEGQRARGWTDFRHVSLLNLARTSLEANGVDCRGLSNIQISQGALSPQHAAETSWWTRNRAGAYHSPGSFTNVLLDAANKTLTASFELERAMTWRQIARIGQSVQDFKTTHRVALGDMPSLQAWDGYSTPAEISMADSKVSFAVQSYSATISFSYQAIVNDDLSAFDRTPIRLGLAANRTVNTALINAILANPTMPDGQTLFLTTAAGNRYKSNQTSGVGPPSVSTVGALSAKMRLQPGLNTPEGAQSEATLNIRPQFLIVPAALETTAQQLVNSIADPAASGNSGVFNPFQNLEVVVEANMDATSTTAWILAANPAIWDTFEVCFLSGQETPQIRSWTDDATLALNYAVLQSFAPVILDFRGVARHLGA